MAVPGILVFFAGMQFVDKVAQYAQIAERVNVAGDRQGDATHIGSVERTLRQQRRLWIGLIEVFDDSKGLRQDSDITGLRVDQGRHQCGRIEATVFGCMLLAAVAKQVYRNDFVRQFLQVQRNAHPIGRRTAEVAVEFHAAPPFSPL